MLPGTLGPPAMILGLPPETLLILAAILVLLLSVPRSLRTVRGLWDPGVRHTYRPRRLPPSGPPKPVPPDTADRARELLARNKRLQAIKEIRQATGYGLQEAKDISDAIEAGRPVPCFGQPEERPDPELVRRVRQLRAEERGDEAVRLVVEQTGMGESDAARFVDSLD
ncbi:ribosomal protein L7/L12 [Streptomonospora sp. PA3]|uniref:hypothetical protein n=1 Tax=Streptomonospora sp. PA3 TaxID=2607326 RepID=UPI0012DD0041|nr:hypothetical protein [Streptomonospora sp. PA3]MUL43332.1 ribosomal protein L7/L12 [Streptomonospora sp. PA3]